MDTVPAQHSWMETPQKYNRAYGTAVDNYGENNCYVYLEKYNYNVLLVLRNGAYSWQRTHARARTRTHTHMLRMIHPPRLNALLCTAVQGKTVS